MNCGSFRSPEKATKIAPPVGGEDHVIIDNGRVGDEVLKRTGGRGDGHRIELIGGDKSLRKAHEH
jgi:hypothetical protein